MKPDIFRIVAHTDFDGLISALFLRVLYGVEEVVFAEPWELQENTFTVHKTDAVVDLPYPAGGCVLWVDHHDSNALQEQKPHCYFDATKKSCPSLIFEVLPHERLEQFRSLLQDADKIDGAEYTREDIQSPTPAMQISMSINTNKKREDDLYRLFLLEQLEQHPLATVASMSIVQQRFKAKWDEHNRFLECIDEYARLHGIVLVVDLSMSAEYPKPSSFSHFGLYLRYPQAAITLLITKHDTPGRLRLAVGENIFYRINNVHIGTLMKSYGGGGHKGAGGCSIPEVNKEELLEKILVALNSQ